MTCLIPGTLELELDLCSSVHGMFVLLGKKSVAQVCNFQSLERCIHAVQVFWPLLFHNQ